MLKRALRGPLSGCAGRWQSTSITPWFDALTAGPLMATGRESRRTGFRQPGRSTKEARSVCFIEVGDRGAGRVLWNRVPGPVATPGAPPFVRAPAAADAAAAGRCGSQGTGAPGMTGVQSGPRSCHGTAALSGANGRPRLLIFGSLAAVSGRPLGSGGSSATGPEDGSARPRSSPAAGSETRDTTPAVVSRIGATAGFVVT